MPAEKLLTCEAEAKNMCRLTSSSVQLKHYCYTVSCHVRYKCLISEVQWVGREGTICQYSVFFLYVSSFLCVRPHDRLRWSKNWFLSCRVHERWIVTSYLRGGSETRDWGRMELRHTYFVSRIHIICYDLLPVLEHYCTRLTETVLLKHFESILLRICMFSGFCHEVYNNCVLLGYYAVSAIYSTLLMQYHALSHVTRDLPFWIFLELQPIIPYVSQVWVRTWWNVHGWLNITFLLALLIQPWQGIYVYLCC